MSAVYTPTRYKLTIEDYHKLGEAGILNEDSRVELIEGELIQMAPIGGPHLWVVTRLTRLLVLAVGERAEVSPQNPVILPPDSEPQPDFAVLRLPTGETLNRVPYPSEVLLLVEVSDTTLRYDRGTKLRLYAKTGIPEVWIVDINGQRVECHRDPSESTYRDRTVFIRGEFLSIEQLPGTRIAVDDIFPGA